MTQRRVAAPGVSEREVQGGWRGSRIRCDDPLLESETIGVALDARSVFVPLVAIPLKLNTTIIAIAFRGRSAQLLPNFSSRTPTAVAAPRTLQI